MRHNFCKISKLPLKLILRKFQTEEEMVQNEMIDLVEIATSITAVAVDCSTGAVPLLIPPSFFRTLCISFSEKSEKKCSSMEFMEYLRSITVCKLKAVHSSLSSLTVEIELSINPVFLGKFTTFEAMTFDFFSGDSIQRLNIPNGIFLSSLSLFSCRVTSKVLRTLY